jgi:hypothetical protein
MPPKMKTSRMTDEDVKAHERPVSKKELGIKGSPGTAKRLPGQTIGFVEKTIERGPNKGMRHVMRKFRAPDGSVHTSPVGGSPAEAKKLAKKV